MYEGASGETRRKLKLSLQFGPDDETRSLFKYINTEINKPQKSTLYMANKLFSTDRLQLSSNYTNLMKSIFNSTVGKIKPDSSGVKYVIRLINPFLNSET